ncbi:MAG: AAA family ATPase [Chloroflexota bacterium]
MTKPVTIDSLLKEAQLPQQGASRYTWLTADDALQPLPPIEWIIEDLISAGSVSILSGPGGSKKTFFTLDMGVSVASGKQWLHFSTQLTTVLFIDEESGPRRFLRRLGQVLRGHNAGKETPIKCASLGAFDFGNPDDIMLLQTLIIKSGAGLVIIDALTDVMAGRDENSVQSVQPIIIALRKVAEFTQAAIVIIHHNNKSGYFSGSRAIRDAVDLMLMVESQSKSRNIRITTEKARDFEPITFSAVACFEEEIFYLTEGTVELKPIEKNIVLFLYKNIDSTIEVITGSIETIITSPNINSIELAKGAVRNLKKLELIKRTDSGGMGRGIKAFYGLTDKGREYAEKNT